MGIAAAGIYPDHLSYFNEMACLLKTPSNVGLDGGTRLLKSNARDARWLHRERSGRADSRVFRDYDRGSLALRR